MGRFEDASGSQQFIDEWKISYLYVKAGSNQCVRCGSNARRL